MPLRDSQIEKLKADLAAKTRVTIVVGSGLSVAATKNQRVDQCEVAKWSGFLQHGARHCFDNGLLKQKAYEFLLQRVDFALQDDDTNELIQVASTITRKLQPDEDDGDGYYRAWLNDTVGTLRINTREEIDAVVALPGVLTTLKYDHLLEQATGYSGQQPGLSPRPQLRRRSGCFARRNRPLSSPLCADETRPVSVPCW